MTKIEQLAEQWRKDCHKSTGYKQAPTNDRLMIVGKWMHKELTKLAYRQDNGS